MRSTQGASVGLEVMTRKIPIPNKGLNQVRPKKSKNLGQNSQVLVEPIRRKVKYSTIGSVSELLL